MTASPLSSKCPKCGSSSIRRTRSTALDRIFAAFGLRALKCRDCRRRFHTRGLQPQVPEKKSESERSESTRRRKEARLRELRLYGFALLAFLVLFYMVAKERGFSE